MTLGMDAWAATGNPEAALVGALLLEPDNLALAAGCVKPADFADSVARTVFTAMLTLHADGKPVDSVLVLDELRRRGDWETVGGGVGLASFADAATSGANTEHYARSVADAAGARRMAKAITDAYLAMQEGQEASKVFQALRESLDKAGGTRKCLDLRESAAWIPEPSKPKDPILLGVFNRHDKVFVIGPSKCRKSFFVMQLSLALAAGKSFIGFEVPVPKRVLVCQYEITADYYHDRLLGVTEAMRLLPDAIAGNHFVLNLRGAGASLDDIVAVAKPLKPDVIIFDPLYKTYPTRFDENSAGDMAAHIAKFEAIGKDLGCAVIIVHHDSKVAGGDIKATARGAGSGLLGRDTDTTMILTPHAEEDGAVVVDFILRNRYEHAPMTILWDVYRFAPCADIMPIPETTMTRRIKMKKGATTNDMLSGVSRWFTDGPIPVAELRERIKATFSVGRDRSYDVTRLMVARGFREIRCKETKQWDMFPPETVSEPTS